MSLGEILRQVMIADTVDLDPADIAASEPGEYPSADDVPVHKYTSLATLLGVDEDELARRVVASYGQGKTLPQDVPSIEIKTKVEDNYYSKLMNTDYIGGETSDVQILFRSGEKPVTEDGGLTINLELRTRFLLDELIRRKRGAGPISTAADKTISSSYFICRWVRCDEGEIEILAKYTLDYVRRF